MRIPFAVLVFACASPHVHVAPVPVTAASAAATRVTTRDELVPKLTASDGTGLELVRFDARAVVEGPLAFTELHLFFSNPEARIREGTFQITLPPRAAVARFAMESDGHWLEAELVPKQVARRAYDDALHRRTDPALLERAAGNQFMAKVFPIAANADKHVVISYSEELPGARYVLPLRGLPKLAHVGVTVGDEHLVMTDWQPDHDFVATAPRAAAVGAGGLVAAEVEVASTAARDVPTSLALLVDTSASRAPGFDAYVASVHALVAKLAPELPIVVSAFDQTTEVVYRGRAGAYDDSRLRARGADGASDLGQALASVAGGRVVIVTDGVVTAGVEGAALHAAAKRFERVDVALAGGLRDDRAAALVARAGSRAGGVVDLDADPAVAIAESVAVDVPVTVAGATWTYPQRIASARAGTKVLVLAKLPATQPTIDIATNGVHRVLAVANASGLVERAIAAAELGELETRFFAGETALRAQIAKRSIEARVLSSETAMLVLESEADYKRYGITTLPDVLVVGPSGLERQSRKPSAIPPHAVAGGPPVSDVPGEPPPATEQVDNDHDGILDDEDGCPDDGCPERGRLIMTSSSIEVLMPIHFRAGTAELLRDAAPILDSVAATLIRNPSILTLEIQGHTDERGDDLANLELSDRRAQAVRQYLIEKGVAAARLTAQGYGETQPIDRGHNEIAWARNRRVDFVITRRGDGSAPAEPLTGDLADIEHAIARHDLDAALVQARAWHAREPGNVLALVGLGDVLEARGADASRIYGSIIDLYPGRADLRRFAGERLRTGALALDTYRRAVADRPDHMTGHRLLAYALVRAGKLADAFAAITTGLDQTYRDDSYAGGRRVLGDDAAMIGAAYAAAEPGKRADVIAALARHQLAPASQRSTRFILYWETDANDVDLHVRDAHGGHAYYGKKQLPSGGELYADITTGYGPECFVIPGAPAAGPYELSVDYFSQGPMGFGMGMLEIETFDPARGFTFEDRPYVIMTPHAAVALGKFQ